MTDANNHKLQLLRATHLLNILTHNDPNYTQQNRQQCDNQRPHTLYPNENIQYPITHTHTTNTLPPKPKTQNIQQTCPPNNTIPSYSQTLYRTTKNQLPNSDYLRTSPSKTPPIHKHAPNPKHTQTTEHGLGHDHTTTHPEHRDRRARHVPTVKESHSPTQPTQKHNTIDK